MHLRKNGMYEKLKGRHLYCLGSSVTYGAEGHSFVEDLAEVCGCICTKEAVSGTTLVDTGADSYIARMKAHPAAEPVELFLCQLSTNDASRGLPLGAVSAGRENFDTSTVAGALEYIIAWAKENYGCPVAFYTNPWYDSDRYAAMVELLHELQKKWGFFMIDLWNEPGFSDLPQEDRARYMSDPIHPTRAGYRQWWLPIFAERLCTVDFGII